MHYRDGVPAVIEATRVLARQATRPETPARLRLWAAATVLTAAALLLTTSLVLARVQQQVRVIGEVAAPQAATAADLYFALSDMDAQVARMVLTAGRDDLAAGQIDALGAYRQRSRQVDTDLQRSLTTATDDTGRALVLGLLHDLATYRERVWQALTAGPAAAGYYTQAVNVLHLDLLPAATALRQQSEKSLEDAYAAKRATRFWGETVAVLLGLALLWLLVGLQVWLARRFRRVLNPALIAATLLTVLLVVPVLVVLGTQERRLATARDDSLVPFLALSRARAVSYDAAADTSRYLISDRLRLYGRDFDRKAGCLATGASCDTGLPAVAAGSPALDRWTAYRRDHDRIVALADAGRGDEAVAALTGIRRGDAAFDFSYYDAAVAELAAQRRAAFDDAMRDTRRLLAGSPYVPPVLLGLVLLLVPLAVRRRLAEYR